MRRRIESVFAKALTTRLADLRLSRCMQADKWPGQQSAEAILQLAVAPHSLLGPTAKYLQSFSPVDRRMHGWEFQLRSATVER
jgi:hypothetical protein